MNTSYRAVAVLAVFLPLLMGCMVEHADAEGLGSAESALLTTNTLTTNTLTTNTLTTNTLTTNGLGAAVVTALQETTPVGASNRTVFHYMVGCALAPTQSVTYTRSDATGSYTVTEVGQLGLATQWSTGSLNRAGQQLVSGCIAARVNYFGVTVHISARNWTLESGTTSAELAAYPFVEGAFWGNLFTANPHLSSCYNPANVDHSRADQRECATGYLDASGRTDACGLITLTGSCDDQCDWLDSSGQFYWGCGNNYTDNAITVGLQ